MLNTLGLGFVFSATDQTAGVMGSVEKNLERLEDAGHKTGRNLEQSARRIGGAVVAAGVGFAGLQGAFALADQAAKFESAIAAVGAVSQATTEELQLLKKAALDAGQTTQFNPTEVTQALGELAQAGFTAKESIDLLAPTLDLAAGSLGQLSPAEAAGVAAQSLKAFGIDARLAGNAVDQMLQASNAFAMRADDLPLALGIASRGAQSLNQSLTETIVAVGLVKNVIPGTERAATSVAVAMERLAKPKAQEALKKLGVEVVSADGNFRRFFDIVADMIPALEKMSLAERTAFLQSKEMFGAEGMGGLNAILTQVTTGIRMQNGEVLKGGAALKALRTQFAGATDVAKDFSERLLDTYDGQKKLLAGTKETLMTKLGEPFTKVLRPAVELAITSLRGLTRLLEATPESMQMLIAGTFVFGSALLMLGGTLAAFTFALPFMKIGLVGAAVSLKGFAVAAWAAAAPFAPFILGAAAVAGVIYAIRNNVFGLGDAWDYWVGVLSNDTLQSVGKWLLLILGPLAGGAGVTVGLVKLVPLLTGGVTGLAAAFRVLGAAMLMNPLGLIIGGLSAVVLGILAVKNNWLGLGDAWHAGAMIIGEFFDNFAANWAAFKEHWQVGAATIADAVERMLGWFDKLSGFTAVIASVITGEPVAMGEAVPDPMAPRAAAVETKPPVASLAAAMAAPVAAEGMPSVASTEANAEMMSSEPTELSVDYGKLADAMSKRPITTIVELDGDRVAEATSNAQRSNLARRGVPVAPE